MDRTTRAMYREKYKNIKKTVTAGTMISAGAVDGVQFIFEASSLWL
jgi:hypothetical protein